MSSKQIMALFLLCFFMAITPGISAQAQDLQTASSCVMFINAGDADAILVRSNDKAFMIDTGAKFSVPKLFAALDYLSITSLDGVFITHEHSDHLGGLSALAQRVEIKCVYAPGIAVDEGEGSPKIIKRCQKNNLPLRFLYAGDQVAVNQDTNFQVIGPLVRNTEDPNDNSLVMRLTLDQVSYLFTGDMQFAQEETLLSAGIPLKADVLKVGNHGNRDATSPAFAQAVSPAVAVISADTTSDGDSAHPKVISNLKPAKVYVTQETPLGYVFSVQDGKLNVSPAASTVSDDLGITLQADQNKQIIRLISSSDVDLSGFFLYSSALEQVFIFPQGTTLFHAKGLTIGAKSSNADHLWLKKNIVSTKEDTILLFDRHGNVISSHQIVSQ